MAQLDISQRKYRRNDDLPITCVPSIETEESEVEVG